MENVNITMWRECSDDPNFMEQFDSSGPIGERITIAEWEARRAQEVTISITLNLEEDPE